MIKKIVKKIARKFNIEIAKSIGKPPILNQLNIDIVFDIGANVGQYGLKIRENGYRGKILSIEPTNSAYSKLLINSRNDDNWVIHARSACGSKMGQTKINVSANSQSSSILNMNPIHSEAAPNSHIISYETTPIITLDSIYSQYAKPGYRSFLKIDTQGYEEDVLMGSMQSLPYINGIEIELSLVELYEGQKLYDFYLNFMHKNNFALWDIKPVFYDPNTGRLLQFDAIFIKR